MEVNYIVVGAGLAGIAFCEQLRQNKKSYLVFDDATQQSSKVAGGIFNPVVLKRFTACWKAHELLHVSEPYYQHLEKYLNVKLVHEMPISRILNSIEEQNNWITASDHPILSRYLSSIITPNKNVNVNAKHGFGQVKGTGRIDTEALVEEYLKKLTSDKRLHNRTFDYQEMECTGKTICYQDIKADNIVFADGFGLKNNPIMDYLPLRGSKGEYLTIRSSELELDHIVKGPVFIIPLGNDNYLVGATYNNMDKTNTITESAKEELITKLRKMILCDFKIIDQVAAIRPTVKDRRPLVGCHPEHNNIWALNGLGTRGVMASPYCAAQLFQYIENSKALDPEIDINRYENLFVR
ncbi:MAG: FAD-binding oxidoreductase [Flavobacteriaceae bacterium]|nr:FAD-binding oxidoreductase [Bacteroidia bacterium]NND09762.1 FAD-dependent oxidoreductase [Flavobacteriaceae bacterium]NNK27687.1 FAD-dependent oxidoreductase [Flavobacteriaceae bacterium]NNL60175.1 FAD-dependent oxidoreductase [Flavobacteriaceae bacterium]RZV60633.1 MAG: FAD-binding oxidoreductase [Flavobacteriaceae bacterium]